MRRQRGVIMLISLVFSVLLGLLAASALRDAMREPRLSALLLSNAQALEQAEATVLEALAGLSGLPPACPACLPPSAPHTLQGHWQRTASGYFQLQNLGVVTRAAHLPRGESVQLIRITAVSLQARARHVIEAVYALRDDPGHVPQRVLWRQRLKED